MRGEKIVGGGTLCRVHGGSGLAVEGVPGARRGMIVRSMLISLGDGGHKQGQYRLTQRAVKGTDLWRVARLPAANVD